MIWALLRRDPGLRGRLWAKAIVLGILLANMYGLITGLAVYRRGSLVLTSGSPDLILIAGLTWLLWGIMIMIVRGNLRATPLDLTLPIPARTLWLARSLATLLIGTVMLAAMLLTALGLSQVRGVPHGPVQPVMVMTLHLWASSLLALGLLHHLSPRLAEVTWSRANRPRLLRRLAATLVLVLALLRWLPAWGWLIPAAAGGLLLARAWRRLPQAFVIADREPEAASPAPAKAGESARTASRPAPAAFSRPMSAAGRGRIRLSTLLSVLFPVTPKKGLAVLLLPVVAIYGVMLGRHSSASFGAVQIPWIWIMLIMFFSVPLGALQALDALPLSRRRILPWILLPGMVVAILALLAARGIGDHQAESRGLLACRETTSGEGAGDGAQSAALIVPGIYHEIAWDGRVPEIVSPGGERHTPASVHPVRGLKAAIYSPFDTPPGCSPEYVAWQIERAVAAAYGARIPAAELSERYLVRLPGGGAGMRAEGFTLLADYPDLEARPRAQDLPFILFALAVPWFFVAGWGLRLFSRFARGSTRRIAFPLLAVIPLTASLGFLVATQMQWIEPDWIYAGGRVCARVVAAALPASVYGIWGLLALALLLGYRFAEARFLRMEAPAGD